MDEEAATRTLNAPRVLPLHPRVLSRSQRKENGGHVLPSFMLTELPASSAKQKLFLRLLPWVLIHVQRTLNCEYLPEGETSAAIGRYMCVCTCAP